MMRLTAAAFVVLVCSVIAAPAQIGLQKNCQTQIDSDKTEASTKEKEVSFIGNVVVTNCDDKIRADRMRVTTVNGDADRITATGRVVVNSPKAGVATADNGVYEKARNIVTLSGRVVLKKGTFVSQGAVMTVNLTTGIATLGGGNATVASTPGTPEAPPGRVRAVFGPPAQGAK